MTDDLRELVTAAIDGELAPAEQERLNALLAASAEARTLFARLQSDSIRLKDLSQVPPANLVARVLSKLPMAEPVPVRRERVRSWLAAGIAASVALAIASAYVVHLTSQPGTNPSGTQMVRHDPDLIKALPREVGSPQPALLPPSVPSGSNNVAQVTPEPLPEPPSGLDQIPPPRVKGADVFVAGPLPPIPPFERFVVRVPLLVSIAELERDDAKQRLLEELGRDPAYRIDLFAKDASRAAELFQNAAKTAGVNLFADSLALDRMKKKQATSYLVYSESLSAADIRDLLVKISEVDAKNPERAFDALHATPALLSDQNVLKDLLGTDPGLWKRPMPAGGEPKSISSGTGDELSKTLSKNGDKSAVFLSFTPAASRTNPALSKELKEFLARRGERKASAVPILIVIRQP